MTIDEIKKWMLESSGFPVTQANAEYLERFQAIAFQAGAASRDAEVAQWQKIIDEEAKDSALVIIERDQLRANIISLIGSLIRAANYIDVLGGTSGEYRKAVMLTPKQSIAQYRNKVIEECAAKCKDKHVNGNWMYDYREECEAAILDMKEQP